MDNSPVAAQLKSVFPLPQESLVVSSSLGKWHFRNTFPHPWWNISIWSSLVQATRDAGSWWGQRLCQVQNIVFHSTLFIPWLLHHPAPLLRCSLNPRGDDIDIPLSTKHYTITHSQQFDQLWISVLTGFHCTQERLWPRLRAALICVYKLKYIENSLIPCTLSETTVVHSPLEPRFSLAFGFWPDLQY